MRFLEPSSKLRSVHFILNRFQKAISHDQVLRLMDHLSMRDGEIKKHLTSQMLQVTKGLDILLFDVMTLYFESSLDSDLKKFGFSKDSKFKEVQVVLALLTDSEGLPITYEVFPGNTSETRTFIDCIKKLKGEYKLKRVKVTADRAMFSENNLCYFESEDAVKDGISEYIVACPLNKKLSKAHKEKILDKKSYTRIENGMQVYEFEHEGRRMVVIYSSKRASYQKHQREVLLDRIKKLEDRDGKISNDKLSGNRGIKRYLEKCKGFTKNSGVSRRYFLERRGEGVGIILNESEQLSGKRPTYEKLSEELKLTIFAAQSLQNKSS